MRLRMLEECFKQELECLVAALASKVTQEGSLASDESNWFWLSESQDGVELYEESGSISWHMQTNMVWPAFDYLGWWCKMRSNFILFVSNYCRFLFFSELCKQKGWRRGLCPRVCVYMCECVTWHPVSWVFLTASLSKPKLLLLLRFKDLWIYHH